MLFQPLSDRPSVLSCASFYPQNQRPHQLQGDLSIYSEDHSLITSPTAAAASEGRRLSSQYCKSTKTLMIDTNSNMQVRKKYPETFSKETNNMKLTQNENLHTNLM